jgi:hypothetical protein
MVMVAVCLMIWPQATFAFNEFKDLPKQSTHWASDAVYDLVNSGVTTGYPDGTFRGNNFIDRFEVASFLSKFYHAVAKAAARREKLVAELRWEVEKAKYDLADYKNNYASCFSGEIIETVRFYRLWAGEGSRGPYMQYRLKSNLQKQLGPAAKICINFDTNDAGFGNAATREVALTMFDLSGQVKLGKTWFGLSVGPGSLIFSPVEVGRFEDDAVYLRPKTSLFVTGDLLGILAKGAYVAHQIDTAGKINLNEFRTDFTFGTVKLPGLDKMENTLTAHYLFPGINSADPAQYHLLGELSAAFGSKNRLAGTIKLGVGKLESFAEGGFFGIEFEAQDCFKTGTNFGFSYKNVGSRYRTGLNVLDTYDFVGLNYFSEPVSDGRVDCGLYVLQKFGSKISLAGIVESLLTNQHQFGSDYAGTRLAGEVGFNYDFSKEVWLKVYYKLISTPSGIDQFSLAVDPNADELGIKVGYRF